MNDLQKLWLTTILFRVSAARVLQSVSNWCEENLIFNEPDCTGPFTFAGREYLREPLDCWGDDLITDITLVFGTRMGKTRVNYGGLGWVIKNRPCRAIFVKPKTKGTAGAEDDARTRFIPMLRASPALADMIPQGTRRHDFKTAQQILAGSIVDWTGSNSVAALASNPARVVIQDEVDKFNATRRRDDTGQVVEADASSLADERCKEFSNPKRIKSSTPTLPKGKIWQELLKSDLRRRFMPCPLCGVHHPKSRLLAFGWNADYSGLPAKFPDGSVIPVGYVQWDKEAKRANGTWDLDRVEQSARIVCPHCQGHIRNEHKAQMDKAGEWKPTQKGAPAHVGFHAPGMYAQHRQADFGKMAVRFLKAMQTGELRGVINSDLAEPYQGQDRKAKAVVISSGLKKNREGIPDRNCRLGLGDRQKGSKEKGELPHWWHLILDVKLPEADGQKIRVRVVSEGKCLTDENMVQTFKDHEVFPDLTVLDSGWDTDHVYALCMANGYYCLKVNDSEKRFAGHADAGWKIWSPKKPLHTIIGNFPPKYEYVASQGGWVPHPLEPMFMHVAKYPLMDFFNYARESGLMEFEVPEDVSEDFKAHMNAWVVEERKKSTGELTKRWLQINDRDDLYQLCCYGMLMMLDGGLFGTVNIQPTDQTTK